MANNSGSYRGFTINAWSSFMNTYAYSRVPQSGSLSSQPDPYGVKTDSYVVNFPYTGAYQIEAAADNVVQLLSIIQLSTLLIMVIPMLG